jgi:hypothetical protein
LGKRVSSPWACRRVDAPIERATERRRLARSTRDERINHICVKFLQMKFSRTRRRCLLAQKQIRFRAGPSPRSASPCSARSLGGRQQARPWRTRPLLRGCYWSAWRGVRRPPRPQVHGRVSRGHTGRAHLVPQFVQPLNKGCIKNSVAVTSSNLNVALEDTTIRQITLRTPPGGGSRVSPPERPGLQTQTQGRQPTR